MSTIIFDFDGTLVELARKDEAGKTVCYATEEILRPTAGCTCVLVTGSPREEVDRIMIETGMNAWVTFVEIVAAEQGGLEKRTGEAFRAIIEQYGPAVVIGDSDTDEQGARAADCPFVRVAKMNNSQDHRQELQRCVTEAIRKM